MGRAIRKHWGEHVYDAVIVAFVTLFALACIFPFVYVISFSITPYQDYLNDPMNLIPLRPTLAAYERVLSMPLIYSGYRSTLIITTVGTLINLAMLCLSAYPLTKSHLKGRNVILSMIIFTMFFNGGLIPNFYLIRTLKLYDTLWALMLPGALSTWNLIMMKNFMSQLPDSLEESAIIDGANEIVVLFRILLPLSLPAIATFALFHAVGHWNSFFSAIIYLKTRSLWPLMLILREMIIEDQTNVFSEVMQDPEAQKLVNPFNIKMAVIIVSILPILVVYPFVQKYFMKGLLVGSVKG